MQPYYPTAQIPVCLRLLSHEEQANIERFAPEIAKARDHFQLFRIFISNYSKLVKTISRHLVVGNLQDKEKVEFDRVLLNLLSSGRAITDHFTRYFEAQFGNTEHSDKLKKFLAMLREKSWLSRSWRTLGTISSTKVFQLPTIIEAIRRCQLGSS